MSQEEIQKHLREYKTINRLVLLEEIDYLLSKEQNKYEKLIDEGIILDEARGALTVCVRIKYQLHKRKLQELELTRNGSINL